MNSRLKEKKKKLSKLKKLFLLTKIFQYYDEGLFPINQKNFTNQSNKQLIVQAAQHKAS